MEMKVWIFILLFGVVCVGADQYNYDFMDEPCLLDRELHLTSANKTYGFVRPTRSGGYPNKMKCNLTIYAPPEHRLVVRFRRIEIFKPNNKQCSSDYLLLSGNTSTYKYCGYGTPSYALISTGTMIRLQFVSDNTVQDNKRIGFDLYYTAFHTGECHTSGDHASEFRCKKNKRCIPRELTCDRLDNCGDWQDERASTCGLSTGMTVVVSLVTVLVAGTCAVSITMYACAKKKERRNRRARSTAEVGPTVVYAPDGRRVAAGDPDAPPPYSSTVYPATATGPAGEETKVAPPPSYDNPAYTMAPPPPPTSAVVDTPPTE